MLEPALYLFLSGCNLEVTGWTYSSLAHITSLAKRGAASATVSPERMQSCTIDACARAAASVVENDGEPGK